MVQEDAKYKQARRVRNREQRLRAFLNLCGGKRLDEESGGLQPAYRVDGLGIRAEFPKPKGDDDMDLGDNIERKQVTVQPGAWAHPVHAPAARAHRLRAWRRKSRLKRLTRS